MMMSLFEVDDADLDAPGLKKDSRKRKRVKTRCLGRTFEDRESFARHRSSRSAREHTNSAATTRQRLPKIKACLDYWSEQLGSSA
jgi:hypothetical protein